MAAGLLREMIPVLQKLWGRWTYAHDGEHYSFPTSTAVPSVTQKPFSTYVGSLLEKQESHDYALKE